MNIFGSYKKLFENSKQAMLAAIEIYNKPKFEYREEVFVILLINAWELVLLAILSKKRQRIFQPKKRGQDYKTWDFFDLVKKSSIYFPEDINSQVICKNLELLKEYRNKAVHYYNEDESNHCIYVLSQASIKNYRDLIKNIFEQDIVNEINLVLLPLSFNEQPDFVEFFKNTNSSNRGFLATELFKYIKSFEDGNLDTSRLVTQYNIRLETVKNFKSSDFTVVVDNSKTEGIVVSHKNINPDDSHPFYRKHIIGNKDTPKHSNLNKSVTSHQFTAIVWKKDIKNNSKYCWFSKKGGVSPRYSQEMITLLNNLKIDEINSITQQYNSRNKKKS